MYKKFQEKVHLEMSGKKLQDIPRIFVTFILCERVGKLVFRQNVSCLPTTSFSCRPVALATTRRSLVDLFATKSVSPVAHHVVALGKRNDDKF